MNKEAQLKEIYDSAFNDELSKIGGTISEYIGAALLPGPSAIGALAAAVTPTKTKQEMVDQQDNQWSNLIPGVGSYRMMKRMGYSNKELGKELKIQQYKEDEDIKSEAKKR